MAPIKIFMRPSNTKFKKKNLSSGVTLFHADGRMDMTRQRVNFISRFTQHNGELEGVTDVACTVLLSAYGATFTDWLPVCIKTANT